MQLECFPPWNCVLPAFQQLERFPLEIATAVGGGQTGHQHAKPKPHSNFHFNGIYIIYHLSSTIYITSITYYRPCLSIIQQLTSNIYHHYMKSFSFYHLTVFIYHHYHLLSIIYQVLAIVTIYHLSLIIITSQVSPKFIPLSSII